MNAPACTDKMMNIVKTDLLDIIALVRITLSK